MAKNIIFTDGVSKNLKKLAESKIDDEWGKKVSAQLLVLSRREVPFDVGGLQRSGFSDKDSEGHFVAYTEEYAAYQHEGIRADGTRLVRNYQNGRKSKYLEDPLKENLSKWRELGGESLQVELKKL